MIDLGAIREVSRFSPPQNWEYEHKNTPSLQVNVSRPYFSIRPQGAREKVAWYLAFFTRAGDEASEEEICFSYSGDTSSFFQTDQHPKAIKNGQVCCQNQLTCKQLRLATFVPFYP